MCLSSLYKSIILIRCRMCVFGLLMLVSFSVSAVNQKYIESLNLVLNDSLSIKPDLFGTSSTCKSENKFSDEVKNTSLLTALTKNINTEIYEFELSEKITVWFVQTSACYSGATNPGFLVIVREDLKYKEVGIVKGGITDVRLDGGAIVFKAASYAGRCNESQVGYLYKDGVLQKKSTRVINLCEK